MVILQLPLLALLALLVLVLGSSSGGDDASASIPRRRFRGSSSSSGHSYNSSGSSSQQRRRSSGDSTTTRRTKQEPPSVIQQYELWTPVQIRDTLLKWKEHYADFVRVTTSQEAYGLPSAGGVDDCPFDSDREGCLNYLLEVQDFAAHPAASASSNRLPEVLWSGEVHGNERVGPTAVLEAADLLLRAAACEALPRASLEPGSETAGSGDNNNYKAWQQELVKAQQCRQELRDRGITDQHRQWLARLVATRRIVIVPTANALGYYRNVREEDDVDPNRDFPYDLTDAKQCMQTIAARTLNEVFREHMFQLSLTFHGGMEVVGYEWGAPSWRQYKTSPDDAAQKDIAAAYSRFAAGFSGTKPYDYGPMNDLVYPVNGGMEDWAYAASWDTDRVVQCDPDAYGGYPAAKTTYTESTLRVFNMLVETSNQKVPSQQALGTSEAVMIPNAVGNGHVQRNIRLALLAAELVEPYVTVRSVNELDFSDDVVPKCQHTEGRTACQAMRAVAVPHNSRKVVIRWTVGGALTVDQTQLWYAKWDDVPEDKLDCSQQPDYADVESLFQKGTAISDMSGHTKFASSSGPSPPSFSSSLDISNFGATDKIVVLVSARVDQEWTDKPDRVGPDLPPQSHVVNARTNPDWHHEMPDGKVIHGRLDWFSVPVTIELVDYEGKEVVETVELSRRYSAEDVPSTDTTTAEKRDLPRPPTGGKTTPSSSPPAEKSKQGAAVPFLFLIVLVVVGAGGFVGGRHFFRHIVRASHRERVREFIEDESAVSPGLQQKNGKNGYSDIPDTKGEVELGTYA